jgi:hypothetical protein
MEYRREGLQMEFGERCLYLYSFVSCRLCVLWGEPCSAPKKNKASIWNFASIVSIVFFLLLSCRLCASWERPAGAHAVAASRRMYSNTRTDIEEYEGVDA